MEFCALNKVSSVVRAHQPPKDKRGFAYHHQNQCMTVFTASNYTGTLGNRGGVLICDDRFVSSGLQPCEHWAPPWPLVYSAFRQCGMDDQAADAREQYIASFESRYGIPPYQRPKPTASALQRAAPEGARPRAPSAQAAAQKPPDASTKRPDVSPKQPDANASPKANGQSSSLAQGETHLIKQIIWNKGDLYNKFVSADPKQSGVLKFQQWEEIMEGRFGMRGIYKPLAQKWQLGEKIEYVRFLHRFQIISDLVGKSGQSTHVSMLDAMAQLRYNLKDVHCDQLLQALDKDRSGIVDAAEFRQFLTENGIQIPRGQSFAVFDALQCYLNRPPRPEDIVLAIAMISRAPEKGLPEWNCISAKIGEELSKKDSLVSFFRKWDDVSRDGFLTMDELQAGLKADSKIAKSFSQDQFNAFMHHMDNQGLANARISLVEFLRTLGHPEIKTQLMTALLAEVLKPIFFYRPTFLSYLQHFDALGSNVVHIDQFKAGVLEMNRQLVGKDRSSLRDSQVDAVCEIASGGSSRVQYQDFLKSLRPVDVVAREALARNGAACMDAALGGTAEHGAYGLPPTAGIASGGMQQQPAGGSGYGGSGYGMRGPGAGSQGQDFGLPRRP